MWYEEPPDSVISMTRVAEIEDAGCSPGSDLGLQVRQLHPAQ